MSEAKIKKVIFIPSRMCGLKTFFEDLRKFKNKLYDILETGKLEGVVSYAYSEWEYLRMWKGHYNLVRKVNINDTVAYFLKLK